MTTQEAQPLVITGDPLLLDQMLASAAAAGVDPVVVDDAGGGLRYWGDSSAVLVGLDQARAVTELLLPPRTGVVLVGHEADRAALCGWSQPLGATTISLPAGAEWLSAVFAGGSPTTTGGAPIVAIAGGSGGLGVSTLATGLAQRMASQAPVLLVDADPASGGLDLVLGVEDVPGWRWDRLAGARGYLPDLTGELPQRDGVSVLCGSRQSPDVEAGSAAISAVLRSAARGHGAVIVDIGRGTSQVATQVVRQATKLWLVAGADVWSVAASRRIRDRLGEVAAPSLITRERPWSDLGGRQIAELLGLPWLGSIPDDRSLSSGIERGLSPVGAAGRRWLKKLDELGEAVPR